MRTVALVGFAENCNKEAYHLPDEVELWSVNHAHKYEFPRLDRVLDIHNIKHLNSPGYYVDGCMDEHLNWLSQEHSFSIYMQEHFSEYPASVRYPIEDALKLTGSKRHFTSSICYMVALAELEGDIERLLWYGFNMNGEWAYQRPDAYYWKGRAEGAGIEVYIPPESELLPKTLLYGYEGFSMISRQTAEAHKAFYEKQYQDNVANIHVSNGVLQERMKANGGDQEAVNEAIAKVRKFTDQAKYTFAAAQAVQNLINTCDLEEVEPKIQELNFD